MKGDRSRLEFLGELAGGLAHEVKNPLSTMKLQLEMMEEDFERDKSESGVRQLRKVQLLLKEIRRLEEIVHEFLDFSRGHDLKLAAVDFGHFLDELIELVRPEAERHNVNVRLQVLNPLGAVLIDENYLHRALLNLVQNAIQACEPKGGGDVILQAGKARDSVGLAIIDTGVGIPQSARDRIFRAYFSTKPTGNGMGLPMARRIIEEHNGYLAFDSVEGQGSRFMVMLPISSGEALTQMVVHPSASVNVSSERPPIDVPAAINAVLAESKLEGGNAGQGGERPRPVKTRKT